MAKAKYVDIFIKSDIVYPDGYKYPRGNYFDVFKFKDIDGNEYYQLDNDNDKKYIISVSDDKVEEVILDDDCDKDNEDNIELLRRIDSLNDHINNIEESNNELARKIEELTLRVESLENSSIASEE